MYELTDENGTPITGDSGTIGDHTYTVTTDNTDAFITREDLTGIASIVNNKIEKGELTVDKAVFYNDALDTTAEGNTIIVGVYRDAAGERPVQVGDPASNRTEVIMAYKRVSSMSSPAASWRTGNPGETFAVNITAAGIRAQTSAVDDSQWMEEPVFCQEA